MRVEQEVAAISAERARSRRLVQVTLGTLSLLSLGVGMTVYALAGRLGVAEDTARLIASSFLVAAVADALVLIYWERLFPRA